MSKQSPWHNRDLMYKLYVTDELSMHEVAERVGCTKNTVSRWLRKLGIASRPQSETMSRIWADPNWRKETCATMRAYWKDPRKHRRASRASKAAHRRGCYDGVFQSPTSIEIATEEALAALGYAYIPEYRPTGYTRPYDFYVFPDILIEVQGDYWHTRDGARDGDAEKAKWARQRGFVLIELWEHDIRPAVETGTMSDLVKGHIEAACSSS